MTIIPLELLQAYSWAEITRRELAGRVGREVSFGTLLGQLHAHGLKLPRVPSDPNSVGVELIRQLASRKSADG